MRRGVALSPCLLTGLLVVGGSTQAFAYPLLQFDIKDGAYSTTLQETVATSKTFTLYAYLTDPTSAQLSDTYYISAALTPNVFPPGGNFGSFTVANSATNFTFVDNYSTGHTTTTNSTRVNATGDMVYGDPPLERYGAFDAGSDPGDLGSHGIYDTYFKEFSFKFSSALKATPYDVMTDLNNGPTPSSSGTMYYQAFTISTASLSAAYQIHFDMYNEYKTGGDLDVNKYASFSRTARSAKTPEPASLVLLGTGMAALVARYRRRRSTSPD